MKDVQLSEFKSIAIIQTAFLGDVALALPLAQAVRELNKSAEITFVTTPVSAPLVASASVINHVITYDKRGLQSGLRGIKYLAESLQANHVDCIIAPHRSLRTTLLTYFTKPVYSVSFNISSLSFLYSKTIKHKLHLHEIDRNLSLLSTFSDVNIENINTKVELDMNQDDDEYVDSLLSNFNIKDNDKVIVIAPGSVWATKRWLEEHFVELSRMLNRAGFKTVMTGSRDDFELCRRISEQSNSYNLAGKTSIPQTLCLLKKVKLLVTNDSAPTHLAGLSECPAITIYGPTTPMFGFGPRGARDKVVEIENMKCRPCRIHGSNNCPIKTHECMVKITPEAVFEVSLEVT